MKPDPAKLLGPLLRAVKADQPTPAAWREPLVKLVALLLSDRDACTSVQAARVLIEMEAANLRSDSECWRIDGSPPGLDPEAGPEAPARKVPDAG